MRAAGLVTLVLLPAGGCASAAQTPSPEPVEITLQRTTCFGTCPEYTVTLKDDGTVSYSGRQ